MRPVAIQQDTIQEELSEMQKSVEATEMSQKQISKQIESLRSEQGTPLDGRLTQSEKKEIATLQRHTKAFLSMSNLKPSQA